MLSSFCDLPAELLERTVGFIDLPKELLPLALTCKLVCNLIIPNHLEYRVIETHSSNLSLWQSLAANPLLSANVRILRISHEYSPLPQLSVVPNSNLLSSAKVTISDPLSSQSAAHCEEAVNIITGCLRNLRNLTHFTWDLNPHFPNAWMLFPVFSTSFPNLTGITLNDTYGVPEEMSHLISTPYSSPFFFSNLSVTLKHTKLVHYADDLVRMLTHRCPGLTKLTLNVNIDLTQLIRTGTWSHLKHLELWERVMLYGADMEEAQKSSLMQGFLRRNTALEAIYFGTEKMTATGFMQIEGLPQLRSLAIGHRRHDPCVSISTFLSGNSVRNLHFFYSGHPITSSCFSLLAEMTSLRYLWACFSLESLSKVGDKLSRLERLHIDLIGQPPETSYYWEKSHYVFWDRFVDCMLNLRNLTRLTGSALFQFQEPMLEVRDRYIQRLGTLPRLRYLQIFVGPRYYFVNFERDRNGIYSGHSLLTSYPATDEHDPPGPFSFCR